MSPLDRDHNELVPARATHIIMKRHEAHETAISAPTAETLSDLAIERILRIAFAPYRCHVKFQIDVFEGSKKVALIIYASPAGTSAGGKPFIVDGVTVEALRRRYTLLTYIEDVRKELQRRHVSLTANLQPLHADALSPTLSVVD